MNPDQIEEGLRNYLKTEERKLTKQRRHILDVFANAKSHLSIEELYNKTIEQYPNIGIATVYRTMKLLCESGLASGARDNDGAYRYELEQEYHNHLICLKCGQLIEDADSGYEALHAKLARKNNFKIIHTRVELYGTCHECSIKEKDKAKMTKGNKKNGTGPIGGIKPQC
ncbi:MAG: Fur family transcriptional regulator [Negativicutes bacterium]|nr:Fur family transcriptional regulator [Negativicutes bacterium]